MGSPVPVMPRRRLPGIQVLSSVFAAALHGADDCLATIRTFGGTATGYSRRAPGKATFSTSSIVAA